MGSIIGYEMILMRKKRFPIVVAALSTSVRFSVVSPSSPAVMWNFGQEIHVISHDSKAS